MKYPKISIDSGLIKWDKLIKEEIFKEKPKVIGDRTPPVLKCVINGETVYIPIRIKDDNMG